MTEEIKRDDRGREQVKAWYGLAVTTGREKVVRDRLKSLAKNDIWKDQIFRVIIPSIKEIGKTGKEKETLIYTQVVYVEMILNDDTYNAVKIDGVRHILGDPTPIGEDEMRKVFQMSGIPYDEEVEVFDKGTEVVIFAPEKGAFDGQIGSVDSYDSTNQTYVVIVPFGESKVMVDVTSKQLKKY